MEQTGAVVSMVTVLRSDKHGVGFTGNHNDGCRRTAVIGDVVTIDVVDDGGDWWEFHGNHVRYPFVDVTVHGMRLICQATM